MRRQRQSKTVIGFLTTRRAVGTAVHGNGRDHDGSEITVRNCPCSAGPAFQLRSWMTTPGVDDPAQPHSEDGDPATLRLIGGGWLTPAELSNGGMIHGDMGHGEQGVRGEGLREGNPSFMSLEANNRGAPVCTEVEPIPPRDSLGWLPSRWMG